MTRPVEQPAVGRLRSSRRLRKAPPVLEYFFSGILVLAFAFITWFSIYVVYKLYEGQR
jgi:hypothetical protein